MHKILYIDCGYGIAGDMLLSALCGLGISIEYIEKELKKVTNFDFKIALKKSNQFGITANQLVLDFKQKKSIEEQQHNHYITIRKMIEASRLKESVKKMSLAVFATIAQAESKIHGVPIDNIAFHEVGAVDSIIDIIGNCIAIDRLGVNQIECAPIPTGHGKVQVQHGLYPIPAPATLEILRDIPLSNFSTEGELTTPTGAAIVKTLVNHYTTNLEGVVADISYGSGTHQFDHPNVLRALLLERK